MTPEAFISRWADNKLSERAGAQGHFDDLCDLLEVDKPRDPDNYCFERGAKKAGGGDGWADVWKRGHFGWENKKPGRDLNAALKQLTDYALQLDNPPLLVVCDRERIIIHTAFTGYPDEPREIRIAELIEPDTRQLLKWVFTDASKLRPEKSTAAITAAAAGRFAELAKAMRNRGEDGQKVAHFLVQCLFCMFAEDEELLPPHIFSEMLKSARQNETKAKQRLERLFVAMQKKGGIYGNDDIPWFNGGLFKSVDVPVLTSEDVQGLYEASANMDWRAIDPTIFGTLFERGLDPATRAPLGAHYTDTGTIEKLIKPLVSDPLLAAWEDTRAELVRLEPKFSMVPAPGKGKFRPNADLKRGYELFRGFLDRLHRFQVLDPACGSGNFLYLALKALRDVEKRAHVDAQDLGLGAELTMQTGPHNIRGLEINEFAAELARVTVWIGDIQWCRRNGYAHATNPILRPLDGVEHRDALLGEDGNEAVWPAADVIVGNPPFLGGSVMRSELGDAYVEVLRNTYEGRVPGGADLVCFWFAKARAQIEAGRLMAAGLVATNSIRGGANRRVLEQILQTMPIFEAWSDEAWVNEGAAVRVSLIGFGRSDREPRLDGGATTLIHADLTSGEGLDLTLAQRLSTNAEASFQGTSKKASFDITGPLARSWLSHPNPNGRPNSDVVRPWSNGLMLSGRASDKWIIDFGTSLSEAEASLYEAPFNYATQHVRPERERNNRESYRKYWWRHAEARPALRTALMPLKRYIATIAHSKHRFFVWLPTAVCPDQALIVIARSDDTSFGLLHSRFHLVWALRAGTSLEDRPRYTPTTCFETFPFPVGLTPADTAGGAPTCTVAIKIAAAARHLSDTREAWRNPVEWVDWESTPEETAAGFPKRPVPRRGKETDLKQRTLTALYNAPPGWLTLAHQALDSVVAEAYGWEDYTPDMPDDEILRRLLKLNLARSATQGSVTAAS